jgi:hypothetical protein
MAYLQESSRLRHPLRRFRPSWPGGFEGCGPCQAILHLPRHGLPAREAQRPPTPSHWKFRPTPMAGTTSVIAHRLGKALWRHVLSSGKAPKSKTTNEGMAMEHKFPDLQPRLSASQQSSGARLQNVHASAPSAIATEQAAGRQHSLLFTRFTSAAAAVPTQPESRPPFEQALFL